MVSFQLKSPYQKYVYQQYTKKSKQQKVKKYYMTINFYSAPTKDNKQLEKLRK